MSGRELRERKWDAEFGAGEARLDAMHADAKARDAAEEMAAVHEVRTRWDAARARFADLRRTATIKLEESQVTANLAKRELDDALDRLGDRFAAWDDARRRRFDGRLDDAIAKLREWRTVAEREGAEFGLKGREALAKLEEEVALARARLAEWERDRHERKAEEALREAARHFDEAYEAARRQHA